METTAAHKKNARFSRNYNFSQYTNHIAIVRTIVCQADRKLFLLFDLQNVKFFHLKFRIEFSEDGFSRRKSVHHLK